MTLVSQRITLVSAVLMVATLGFGLIVPKVAGIGFLALSALSVGWLTYQRAWLDGELVAMERLFVLFIGAFVVLWLLAWWGHGLSLAGWESLGRMLRLALIIPLFLFVRRLNGWDEAWWVGLIVGAWMMGIFAWWFFLTGQTATYEQRVEGATNPIYFGGIALAFAVMLIPKMTESGMTSLFRAAVIGAVAMAFSASLFSGSRGAWLALLPMVALYSLTLGRRQPTRWRYGLPLLAGLGALFILTLPSVPTSQRFMEGFFEVNQWIDGEMTDGALGRRWHMWLIAMEAMRDHWLTGIGPGGFKEALQLAIDSGEASPLMSPYRHPHNQYLSALTDGGFGLLLLWVLLLGSAGRRFYRLYSSGLHKTRALGWAGLSAITLLAVMSLSESIFERNAGIVWFGFLTATSMGLVQVQRRRELAVPVNRKQRLSVIIITKNESDRIEKCLTPLKGWADEIIVLDSGSEDGTSEIARRFTEKVYDTDWPGYGKQKQRALAMASGDWILSIDADEVLSDALKAEIDLVLKQTEQDQQTGTPAEFDAYTLPWLTHAFGHTLKHGRWSRTPLRLIRQGQGRFTEAVVHETLIPLSKARVGHLDSPLHHYPYRHIAHAESKLGHYAHLQAAARGHHSNLGARPWAMVRAIINFVDNYVFRGACLDGRAGFTLSRLIAQYTYKKYST